MTASMLHVLLAGSEIGLLEVDGARAKFRYAEGWRERQNAMPLSLSMPIAREVHEGKTVAAFVWGLLPDNERILEQWAKRFHVSPRNPFALIANVGEDCAGAVQFVRPERLEAVTTRSEFEVEWLSDADIAKRLAILRRDQSAWRLPADMGQFSLAGAQPKIALLLLNNRWAVPAGRTPTTHILKPPTPEHGGHAENEHFCLSLAKALDLPAATSEVRYFGNEPAIVVQRYDRVETATLAASAAAQAAAYAAETDGKGAAARAAKAAANASQFAALTKSQPILRLHQEDLCQALGLLPIFKYQNEGGPSPADIVALLRSYSTRAKEDVATFVSALLFNWLVAGPDAHGKNYSVLHGGGAQVRLAPLYDIASVLPYDHYDLKRVKLAMKIGGRYELEEIGARQWERLAADLGLDPDETLQRLTSLAEATPDAISQTRADAKAAGLDHPIIDRLTDRLSRRAQDCVRTLRSRTSTLLMEE